MMVRGGAARWALAFPPVLLLVYLTLNLPYILAGVPVSDVLMIYADQAAAYGRISMNAPNIWSILQTHPMTLEFVDSAQGPLTALGIVLGALFGFGVCAVGLVRRSQHLSGVNALWLLTVSAMMFPSILPKMHDRYFFLAEVSAWLLAIVDRRFLLPAILAQAGSLIAYAVFFNWAQPFLPLPGHYMLAIACGLILLAIASLLWIGWRTRRVHEIFGLVT
jgi:Gpi18-like mannosyltransferase